MSSRPPSVDVDHGWLCALVGCCGRTTAGTASVMTDESNPGSADSATICAGVSNHRVVS